MSASARRHFDRKAAALAERYDSVPFEAVHAALDAHLPAAPARVLDIGAGSGRDARALAALGHQVVAVEPSAAFRNLAASSRTAPKIEWIDDRLPNLKSLASRAGQFRFILCSAVIMFLPARDIGASFAAMADLLTDDGVLAISVRDPAPDEPSGVIHRHSDGELLAAAARAGLRLVDQSERADALGRAAHSWRSLVFAKERLTLASPSGR